MKVFAISDLHLRHNLILKTRGFTTHEAHETRIEVHWNTIVGKEDLVFVLGDIMDWRLTNKEAQKVRQFIRTLNGKKILIFGNHDKQLPKEQIRILKHSEKTFQQVFSREEVIQVGNIIFTHEPIAIMHPEYVNVHGHIHEGLFTDTFDGAIIGKLNNNHLNVNVELTGYRPILIFSDLNRGFKAFKEELRWKE